MDDFLAEAERTHLGSGLTFRLDMAFPRSTGGGKTPTCFGPGPLQLRLTARSTSIPASHDKSVHMVGPVGGEHSGEQLQPRVCKGWGPE